MTMTKWPQWPKHYQRPQRHQLHRCQRPAIWLKKKKEYVIYIHIRLFPWLMDGDCRARARSRPEPERRGGLETSYRSEVTSAALI